jgi:isopenicillin-N epimerase
VLEAQQGWRDRMERNPVQFLRRDLEGLLDEARGALASFLGMDPRHLAFMPNTTTGVNVVLQSLPFEPGDELLTTNHAYNACRTALEFVARRASATVITANIPFPLGGPEQVLDAVLAAVTSKTRLALLDHVTSLTGIIFPIEQLISELDRRGIDTLVDGAHAPGMLPLDLTKLQAAYYVGNCHKWLCAPKGSAFLAVRADRLSTVRPLVLSYGADSKRVDRSGFHLGFDWSGTDDPSAWLTVPTAIQYLESLLPGGWDSLMTRNWTLAVEARDAICNRMRINPPCPEAMIGTLAALVLPQGGSPPAGDPFSHDVLQGVLYRQYGIEVLVVVGPPPPTRLLRISAHAYNSLEQFGYLADALEDALLLPHRRGDITGPQV